MPTQRITLDPDPPIQGQTVKICYSFEGLEITTTTLIVTFSPDDSPSSHPVTTENPCVTVSVPGNAESITVEDQDGPSPDKTAPVTPSSTDSA